MLYGCLDDLLQFSELGIGRVYRMLATCLCRKSYRIDRCDQIPEWSRLRLGSHWSCGTRLPRRECVVLVIEHDIRDIEVSAA
jgi:hypothetical protein